MQDIYSRLPAYAILEAPACIICIIIYSFMHQIVNQLLAEPVRWTLSSSLRVLDRFLCTAEACMSHKCSPVLFLPTQKFKLNRGKISP